MDINNISFFKYGECLPELCKLLYCTNSFFRLSVAEPNVLYVCTSVCTIRIEDAFSLDAPTILPVSDFSPLPFVCYYSDGANIKIYVSESCTIWLLVGNVYIQFRHTKYGFLTELIKKVREFTEKK